MTFPTSLFLFGTLRHVPLLAVVLGRDPDASPARLSGYRAMRVPGETYPALHAHTDGAAEGLVIDVTEAELARLDFYEAAHDFDLRPMRVETSGGICEAHVYFPVEHPASSEGPWSLEEWSERHGDAVTLAADNVMALMGVYSAEDVRRQYPSILARAHSRLRAEAGPSPMELRQGPGAESIDVDATRHPYSRFFAVAEADLRFPRFQGGSSRTVTRAAFLVGDAVTVLPYDPARDRVMLIEQFRFGPFMRGDPRPWTLEPVAGRIDPGETPEAAARREAEEEGGVGLGTLHKVAAHYSSPGAVTEFLWSYVGFADLPDDAAGLAGVADEEEDILVHVLPFEQLMDLVRSGEAANAPLVLTAYWLALNRERLRAV